MSWIPVFALIVSVVSILVSATLTITLSRIGVAVRKFERLEDSRDDQVTAIEAKLHDASVKLIDERFRSMTHDLNGHVNQFTLALDTLTHRIGNGETGLTRLVDVDHAMEIKTIQRLDQVKDYIRDYCASKTDVREHDKNVTGKIERMGEKIEVMKVALAGICRHMAEEHA